MSRGHLLSLGVLFSVLGLWHLWIPGMFVYFTRKIYKKPETGIDEIWAYPLLTSSLVITTTLVLGLLWGIFYREIGVTTPYVVLGTAHLVLLLTAMGHTTLRSYYSYHRPLMALVLLALGASSYVFTYDTVRRDRSYTQSDYTASASQLTAFPTMFMLLFWQCIIGAIVFFASAANFRGTTGAPLVVLGYVIVVTIGVWCIFMACMLFMVDGYSFEGRDSYEYAILFFLCIMLVTLFVPWVLRFKLYRYILTGEEKYAKDKNGHWKYEQWEDKATGKVVDVPVKLTWGGSTKPGWLKPCSRVKPEQLPRVRPDPNRNGKVLGSQEQREDTPIMDVDF